MSLLAQAVTTVPLLLQIGVGGIFAILILRLVFDFIERREMKKNNNGGIAPGWAREPLKVLRDVADDTSAARTRLKDLHVWHAPEEGVQEWKNKHLSEMMVEFKTSMEACSMRSAAAIDNNTRVMERIIPILQGLES